MAAIAAMTVSCSSSEDFTEEKPDANGNVKVTLTASMPSASTRTTLTDAAGSTAGMTQTWKSGDGIKVINSSKSYDAQTFTTTSTTATGSFTGTLNTPAAGNQLYALYPSDLSVASGTAKATVDYSAQEGTLAGVASKAVMYTAGTYSTSNTDLGTFTNAGAILRLKLTFPSDVTIKKVALVANGLVNQNTLTLSGNGTATWGTATQGAMIATFGSPKTFSANSATNVYMAALPQTGLKSVTAIAMTNDAIPVYYTCQLSAASVSFLANKVHTLNFTNMVNTDITYTGNESTEGIAPLDMDGDGSSEMVIAENFKWLQCDANLVLDDSFSNNATTGKTYKMMKNMSIDNGVNWIPLGGNADNSSYLMGNFDGNGKKVTGVNYSGTEYPTFGFIGYVYDSVISNLTVEGGTISNTALSASNGYQTGGVVGRLETFTGSAKIIGCSAKFTSISATASSAYVGGVVGSVSDAAASGISINGCRSEIGTISSGTNSSEINATCAGGVVGYSSGTKCSLMTCLADCGTIESTAATYPYVGGIVGRSDGPITLKGNISNNTSVTATGSPSRVGALIGSIASASSVDNCYWKSMTSPTSAIGYGTEEATITNSNGVATVSGFNDATLITNMNTAATATSGYHFVAGTGDNLPTIVKNE